MNQWKQGGRSIERLEIFIEPWEALQADVLYLRIKISGKKKKEKFKRLLPDGWDLSDVVLSLNEKLAEMGVGEVMK